MIGVIHRVKIHIGDTELYTSVSVIDWEYDFPVIGLDLLKRLGACIDLCKNELRLPSTSVKFLPESEIPES